MMGCVGLGLEFVVFCLEKKRIGKDWEIWARFCVDILWLIYARSFLWHLYYR